MKPFAPLALAVVLAASASAQSTFTDPANLRGERVAPRTGRELPIDQGPTGLQQLLRKLNTRASLMLIVAHPDDEDGGMLTFYSRGQGARVGMLTLNRGEGGQNLMTGDFEDALGLLRTQELLAADRYFGADQFFGTEVDFGFSKTKEEAFAKWTHERVLYDAVRAVRLYRPLVIASVFIGGVTDGHGQHQVSGQIAQEVFKAAGDPTVYPELTREGILPWQPLKVYARVPMQAITPQGLFDYATGQYTPAKFTNYVTGEVTTTTPSVDVTVHEGKIDPILGPHRAIEDFVSYVQFARQGLGLQKTQVSGNMRIPPPGAFDVNYHRYGSMLPPGRQQIQEDSFFDGIDTSLAGIAGLAPTAFPELHARIAKIQADINVATDHLDPNNLEKVAPQLADALQQCDALLREVETAGLPNEAKQNVLHELRIKQVQLNNALAMSLNASITSRSGLGGSNTAGSSFPINVVLNPGLKDSPSISRTWIENGDHKTEDWVGTTPAWNDSSAFITVTADAPFTSKITRPYFTRDNIETPFYTLLDPSLRNAPQASPAFTAWITFKYRDVMFTVGHVTVTGDQADSGDPIYIVPEVGVTPSTNAQVLNRGSEALNLNVGLVMKLFDFKKLAFDSFSVKLAPAESNVTVQTKLKVPPGWTARPMAYSRSGTGTIFDIAIGSLSKPVVLNAEATVGDKTYTEGYRAVGYRGIPLTNFYTPATVRIVPIDLKLPQKQNIAYLPGTGDTVAHDLISIGLIPTPLTVADLTPARLAEYDTVILGVRTYAAHPNLHGAPTQALLDYARNGGNVVVQYQTGEFTAADAPFPLAVGNAAERVIDETDPVELLASDSPILTTPNKITPADFNNWIEERGHGFLRTWDDRYTALTETQDPGDPPQRGGLVTTTLGKGRWTYCAFALYRQLPEAVPGAFRLFVNLINP